MKNIKTTSKFISLLLLCASVASCSPNAGKTGGYKGGAQGLEPAPEKKITISYPKNNEDTLILKPQVMKYIGAMYEQAKAIENDYVLHDFYVCGEAGSNYGAVYSNETDLVRVADYCDLSINESMSKKVALVFDAEGFEEGTEFTVTYGTDTDLSDGVSIKTVEKFVGVPNLLSNKTYFWKVEADGVSSELESFHTHDGFRMATASGISNIRDMGGRKVSGNKRIKQGLIYRGGEMVTETYTDTKSGSKHYGNLTEENMKVMRDDLLIKQEIDFRGDEESNNLVHSPLWDEDKYSDIDYFRIPNLAGYDYFFNMNQYLDRVKDMFIAFKNANEKHVYFHCWGGADRTGTVGFLLGGLLGMSYTDLIIDFELTSFSCNYRPHHMNDAKKIYRFPSLIYALKTLKNGSNETYYTPTKPIATIIEEILIDKIGLTHEDIVEIRNNLLEDC